MRVNVRSRRSISNFLIRRSLAPAAMRLSAWCNVDEALQVTKANEEWRQYNGLKYDEELIKNIARKQSEHAQYFIEEIKKPRRMLLLAISTVVESAKTPNRLELYKAREEKLVCSDLQVGGKPVNWNSWRQFNAQATRHEDRKRVYDEFVAKVPTITPIIQSMFSQSRDIWAKHGLDPLKVYLEFEGLSLKKLKNLVRHLGHGAKKAFQEALESYSKEILKKPAEYYDNLYHFRGKVFTKVDPAFKKFDPAKEPLRILGKLGFDIHRLDVDAEERPGKYASPICFGIKIPDDVRLLVRPVSPFSDLESSLHEFGHGMHFVSIAPTTPYWEKYGIAMGIAETFSTFLEGLMKNKDFLSKEMRLKPPVVEDVLARSRFMELFFLTFYAANSLTKIEFWEHQLTMEQADERYAQYSKEFMDMDVPGKYWQLHHVMPDADLYSPSYMIAAVRAVELTDRIRNRFGSKWWADKEAGKYLRELVAPGGQIDLHSFSKLDEAKYLKTIL